MSEHDSTHTQRSLTARVISNFGQSSIDCEVQQISTDGATIQLERADAIPEHFHLLLSDEALPRPCKQNGYPESSLV